MRSIRARSLRNRVLAPLAALGVLTLSACGSAPPAIGSDDAGRPAPDLALPGLEGPVEVLYDDRGVPHIYGTTTHDVLLVQGYLVSRDRFAQMELMRRSAVGRLAEIAGPSAVPDDTVARWAGHGRLGEEIYASLPEDDVARRAVEAFVEGVNLYIDAVNRREEDPAVEGAEILNVVLSSPWFGHWSPGDVFALARFQSANLSFYPRSDVERSLRLAAVLAAFPADADDPRVRGRSGLYEDLFTQAPARPVFTREGFPDEPATALLPAMRPRAGGPFTPQLRALRGALPFLDRVEASSEQVFGDSVTRGSNVWAVTGEHTASGHPILADDPHLALISPAVWWYVHLDTARMGGEDALEVEGTAFPGLPGVIVGFNRRVAWGVAATGDDVTDAYQEDLVGECDAQGDVASGTVRHLGAEHPVAAREETIRVAGADDVLVRLPYPSHRSESQFVPGSCVATGEGRATAISIRYTGWGPSNELAAFFGLMRARDAQEGLAALEHFEVGSQNFVVIDQDEVVWSTRARLPVRDPRARTLTIERGIPSGTCPHMLLSGAGEHEWIGDLEGAAIPHELSPAAGWIAAANQDNVGVTADGNPCNDRHYIGVGDDSGWRANRIHERLAGLVARGDVEPADMIALQAETQSPLGRSMRDAIVAAIDEALAGGEHDLSEDERATLADARDRLVAWTLETPHGVGETDRGAVADSVATTIFNAALTRIAPLALEDEMERAGLQAPTTGTARLLEWMLTTPERLHSYDATAGDSVLWDDLRTEALETRTTVVLRAVLAGLAFLDERLGRERDEWRWGRLHTVRFATVVPVLGARDVLSIPPSDSAEHPDGFPRHGDWGCVDPGNFRGGLWGTEDFSFGSGASQRLVVEMRPEGPRAWNALPGGQSIDPASPHKSDEAEAWVRNEQPPLHFERDDVETHTARRLHLEPLAP